MTSVEEKAKFQRIKARMQKDKSDTKLRKTKEHLALAIKSLDKLLDSEYVKEYHFRIFKMREELAETKRELPRKGATK